MKSATKNSISDLHEKAIQLREQGNSQEALSLYQQALTDYLLTGQTNFLVNVVLEKAITYRHLFAKDKNDLWLVLTANQLNLADQLIKHLQQPELKFLLEREQGSLALLKSNFEAAAQHFSQALTAVDPQNPARDDLLSHQGWAMALQGQTHEAIVIIKKAIEQLQTLASTKRVNSTTAATWLSGAYLRLAAILSMSDNLAAQNYLQLAAETINKANLDTVTFKQRKNQIFAQLNA